MNEDPIDIWFVKADYPESTEYLYRLGLNHYCNMLDKSPNELIEEAEYEEDTIPRMAKRKIDYYLPKYVRYLKEAGRAPQTIKVYLSGVKSFYKYNGIAVPDITQRVTDLCLEKNEGRLLKREEIKNMIEISPIREKTIIYLMALTGMSQAEMRSLTVKKFLDAASEAINKEILTVEDLFQYEKELEKVVLRIIITRKKVNYRYQSFIPPEVTRNILYYLRERIYGRNEMIRVTDLTKELFVSHKGYKLTKNNVSSTFNRIGKKLGFKSSEKGAYGFWRSHGLRKYFISTIINNTGDHILADYLVGHKINKIKRAYWIADPDKLYKEYMKVFDYLSIDKLKSKDVESKEYQELKERDEAKSKELAEIREREQAKDERIEQLEAKLADLEGRTEEIAKFKDDFNFEEFNKYLKLTKKNLFTNLRKSE